jgi:hypothetical protein
MLARLSFTDFDGSIFLNSITNGKITDKDIQKFAPKVVEGTQILSKWAQKL